MADSEDDGLGGHGAAASLMDCSMNSRDDRIVGARIGDPFFEVGALEGKSSGSAPWLSTMLTQLRRQGSGLRPSIGNRWATWTGDRGPSSIVARPRHSCSHQRQAVTQSNSSNVLWSMIVRRGCGQTQVRWHRSGPGWPCNGCYKWSGDFRRDDQVVTPHRQAVDRPASCWDKWRSECGRRMSRRLRLGSHFHWVDILNSLIAWRTNSRRSARNSTFCTRLARSRV